MPHICFHAVAHRTRLHLQAMALVANHPHVDVNGFVVNLPYLARWSFPSHTLLELVRRPLYRRTSLQLAAGFLNVRVNAHHTCG